MITVIKIVRMSVIFYLQIVSKFSEFKPIN